VIHNILKSREERGCNPISYYAAQNDTVWAGGYWKPRLAFGPFNCILEEHCLRHRLQLKDRFYYGKPQEKVYRFVEGEMKKVEPKGVFFMVGDNPRSDIAGAVQAGWYSFLTRTGIHQAEENDPHHPATFVVENFS
jgi:ribonucleotide monophosphatase NagD (HAD superfamily)